MSHVTYKSGVAGDPILGMPDPDLLIQYITFMGL